MKITIALLFGILSLAQIAQSDPRMWGEQGIPVRKGTFPKWNRTLAQDASSNTLVVWSDMHTPSRDIRAQLFNAAGVEQWIAGGIDVSPEAHVQDVPVAVAVDGGWIVAWVDYRNRPAGDQFSWPNSDIYAQKLDDAGNLVWSVNEGTGAAVDVADRSIDKYTLKIVPDGAGGAIIAWVDERDNYHVRAQHMSATGAALWATSLIVSGQAIDIYRFDAAEGADGSMIVVWDEYVSATGYDIYAMKVLPDGTLPWGQDGIAICDDSAHQTYASVIADGDDGSYVAWRDDRNGNHDIYAQRLQSNGQSMWPSGGVAVCTEPSGQYDTQIALDVADGVPQGLFVVWDDPRPNWYPYRIWAQKISADGAADWPLQGVLVSSNQQQYDCDNPVAASDRAGGVICSWEVLDEEVYPYQYQVYAARLGMDGTHLWGSAGQAVASFGFYQSKPTVCVNSAAVFLAFVGDDSSGARNVQAQMLSLADGSRLLGDSGQAVITGLGGSASGQCMFPMSNHRTAVIWQENRGWSGSRLYYQILGVNGVEERAVNGEPLAIRAGTNGSFDQRDPHVCSDAVGGFFASFLDGTATRQPIRLSHVNNAGEVVSSDSGSVVWTGEEQMYQLQARMTPDGQGGCYVAWIGYDQQWYLDLWVMRINVQLQAMWDAPALLCHSESSLDDERLVSTFDGCLVVWPTGDWGMQTLSAAHVTSSGTVVWTSTVCNVVQNQFDVDAVSDGLGGMYVAWRDYRSPNSQTDIYVQRVASNGQGHWGQNGLAVCTSANWQTYPRVIMDGDGNVEIVWNDYREDPVVRMYGQRVTPGGDLLWADNGVPLARTLYVQSMAIAPAANNGLFAAWSAGPNYGYNTRLFATHLDSAGSVFNDPYWQPDSGGAISNLTDGEQYNVAAASDGLGACVVSWTQRQQDFDGEEEGEVYDDLYAQRLYDVASGASRPPAPPHSYALYQNYPNPFNPATQIVFELPKSGHTKLVVFDLLGREVKTLLNGQMPVGKHSVSFDAGALPSGVYIYRLKAGSFQQSRKLVVLK